MNEDKKQDRLIEHDSDGIQEYDNPLPRWWVLIFWATILWSVLYWFNVPGIGIGKGRIANYERDMAEAQQKYAAAAPAAPAMTEEALLALVSDAAKMAAGKQTFVSTCAPCHREDAGGNIGPNLTDEYWIHGGKPLEILNTITNGVLDKGMPAWGQSLKPETVNEVAAYVLTVRGTHPANPKEPQGNKLEETEEAAAPEKSEH